MIDKTGGLRYIIYRGGRDMFNKQKYMKEWKNKNKIALNEYKKEWRLKHKEEVRTYKKKYRQEHPESCKISKKKSYLKHKGEYKEQHRIWCSKNRDKLRQKQRERLLKNPWLKHYWNIRKRCLNKNSYYYKRGIQCLISKEEIKQLWDRDKAYELKQPSIDRKDGGVSPYTYDNCRFIEYLLNCKKNPKIGIK